MSFSPRIEKAIRVALEAHLGQFRKGLEDVPYAVHPVHVGLMLSRHGADDETVAAGLLHDVVEDCDGWELDRVEAEFGARIRGLVAELTEDKSKSWNERKQAAIDHVPELSPEGALIKACDKLHNLQSLLRELQATPDPALVWGKFKGGAEGTLRTGSDLVEALCERVPRPLAAALRATLAELHTLEGRS